MTTHASQNGASAAMEFEATHYTTPEMEGEWEHPEASHYNNPYSTPYSTPEMEGEWEEEWEHPEASHYNNPYSTPYSTPEMEEEWEHPEASHYNNPYSTPEMEEEWEHPEASHYNNPYSTPEMEEEWEHPEASHYNNPYSTPYSTPEMEEEWEGEWEHPEASHYNNPYSTPEADRFIPLLLKGAKMLFPHAKRLAMRVGRSLLNRSRRSGQQSVSQPSTGRDQQIAALFRQLGNVFAQGESEAEAHENELFGSNEFETEVASHPMAHQAALAEMMAAEATHTESESEAQALLAASVPLMINVVRGGLALRQLTPSLVQLNARLVLNLRRQGRPGRQLLATVPAIQRRTLTTLQAIQRTGQPITPRLASQVMAGQTMRVLGNPRICGRALVRNAIIRRQTVAPRRPSFHVRPRRTA